MAKKASKKRAKKSTPPAPGSVAAKGPVASEPPVPGSAPVEPTPPAADPSKGGVQAKVAKAGKQSTDSCDGCEHDYDSAKDPNAVAGKPIRMCTHGSPSIETGGKKLAPCPAEGEGIGLYELTPDEVKLVHEYRIKQGKVGKGKRG